MAERTLSPVEQFTQARLIFVCDVIECMRLAENLQRNGIPQILEYLLRLGHEIPIVYLVPGLLRRNDTPRCFRNRVKNMKEGINDGLIRVFASFRGLQILPRHRQFFSDLLFLLHALVSRVTIGADDEIWANDAREILGATYRRLNAMRPIYEFDYMASRLIYRLADDLFYRTFNCECCLCSHADIAWY